MQPKEHLFCSYWSWWNKAKTPYWSQRLIFISGVCAHNTNQYVIEAESTNILHAGAARTENFIIPVFSFDAASSYSKHRKHTASVTTGNHGADVELHRLVDLYKQWLFMQWLPEAHSVLLRQDRIIFLFRSDQISRMKSGSTTVCPWLSSLSRSI